MREIKFRGKRIEGGEWVYGDLLRISGNTEIYRDGCRDGLPPAVDPATVGQFTVLCDKNGVEIYEGDFVMFAKESNLTDKCTMEGPKLVCWCSKTAGFILDGLPYGLVHKRYEIIGNIHDNPELMKET